MSNLVRPGLVVGDRAYPLSQSLTALVDIEAAFAASITEVFARFSTPTAIRVADFQTLLTTVLRDGEGNKLPGETVAELLQLAGLPQVKAAVQSYMMALAASFSPPADAA